MEAQCVLPAESGLHSEGLQHTAGGSLLQEADHRKSLENLKGKVQAQQEGQVPGRKNLELNVQRNTLHSEQVVFGSRQNAGVGSQVPGGNTNCLKKKPDRMVILGAATVARLMNGPNLRLGNPDEGTDTSRKNKSIIPPLERGPREMMEALMLVEDAITTLSENGARENVGKNEVLAHLCNKKLGRDPNVIRVLDDKFSNSSNIRKWTSTKAIQGARLLGQNVAAADCIKVKALLEKPALTSRQVQVRPGWGRLRIGGPKLESTNDRETLDAYIGHTSEDEAAEFLEPRPDLCTDSPSVEEIRVCTASPSVKDMTFSAWLKSRNKGKKKGGNAANAGVHSLKDSGGEGIHLQPETQDDREEPQIGYNKRKKSAESSKENLKHIKRKRKQGPCIDKTVETL